MPGDEVRAGDDWWIVNDNDFVNEILYVQLKESITVVNQLTYQMVDEIR